MKLSYLQWNIWYQEDIHNIAKYLKENSADVIALQELTVNHPGQTESNTPQYIAKQLGYNYCVGGEDFTEDGEARWFGNAVFSKYTIKSHRQVWINEPIGTGGFDDEYRTYLEVAVDINGVEVIIATTHMSYTHEFKVTERKHAETDKLINELKTVAHKKLIFSGDLNATPNSYTVEQVESLLQNAGPALDEKTWTTKPFSYQGFEEAELNWRLDYVFASKNTKVLSAKVEQTEFSDHLPIRVNLEV